ncbi:SRPBCC family protein [Brevibacterium samyangense]|uniref:Activator of Hsp90 ATPase homologue 1/2-like C-terminal domain-containing protein n=1 Tax=Brevibacterium samyangense TaxID=366888 RepID=A0ABN2TBD4_9MICO
MPVTSVEKDTEALTMTIVADFPVPVSRLWDAYVDPRQIEKFWGPETYPATFLRHDVFPGGRSIYFMTGPEGDRSGGYWEFLSVDPGKSFEVRDGFASPEGEPNPEMPSMRMIFVFSETPEGSRLTTTTYFNSAEELEQLLEMGMEEGTRSAMSQIDAVLADLASFAAGRDTESQILGDTQVRVSRIVRGSVEDVWRAHHEPELMRRWMLGPDGWTMPVCEPATEVGEVYRTEWEDANGENRFGFTGEVLESAPPLREVTTEAMIGMEGEPSTNDLTLTPVTGGTLASVVITYPSAEVRDTVLGTGMVDGMESSYSRLEREVLQSV